MYERFPRSSKYHPDWVIASGGANALWLTEWLAEALDLRPDMNVLDLGCGARDVLDLPSPRVWRAGLGVRPVVQCLGTACGACGTPVSANPVAENSFLIWRGGTVRDFELKIEFRINGTNSGVQYRSKEMPEVGKWVLSGYQADMDFANQFTGNVHNERGPRFFLSQRGNIVRGVDGGGRKQVGTIDTSDALEADIKVNDWNQYHIVVRGWTFMHFINGHLMAVFIDEDTTNRMAEGLLGLQMHVGDPFKVEYRDVWLRRLLN